MTGTIGERRQAVLIITTLSRLWGWSIPTTQRRGTTIYINNEPTIELCHPIMTRPQDWNPTARSILWSAEELLTHRIDSKHRAS